MFLKCFMTVYFVLSTTANHIDFNPLGRLPYYLIYKVKVPVCKKLHLKIKKLFL